jgi:hypothetical protein
MVGFTIFIIMNVLTQAYRTTCIPEMDKLEASIPNEYVGQELEIIIIPLAREKCSTIPKRKRKIGILDGIGDVVFKDNWEMSEEELLGLK